MDFVEARSGIYFFFFWSGLPLLEAPIFSAFGYRSLMEL